MWLTCSFAVDACRFASPASRRRRPWLTPRPPRRCRMRRAPESFPGRSCPPAAACRWKPLSCPAAPLSAAACRERSPPPSRHRDQRPLTHQLRVL
eukprot:3990613-Prymnesium_polylepis.1